MKRLFLLGGLVAAAALAGAEERIALREGIVIDDKSGVAYVMGIDGGISAVDLRSGAVRWKSKAAAKPLAVVNDVLIGQIEPKKFADVHSLEVAALDVRKAGARKTGDKIALPPDVRVSMGETLDGTFSAAAEPRDGDAIVTWQFTPASRRSVRPSPDPMVAPADEASPDNGALLMDIDTGKMTRVPGVPPKVDGKTKPWLLREPADAQPKSDKRRYRSADDRHLLQSERIGDGTAWEKYRWTIYDSGTRKVIGEIRSHLSFAPFVVRGATIVFETTPYWLKGKDAEPAKLRGISLETGKQLWAVPVREIVWRGPVPP
jgi:hypothetical protein